MDAKRARGLVRVLSMAVAGLVTLGCQSAAPGDGAAVGVEEEAVLNGTPIVGTDRLVKVFGNGFQCSGTMLTNSTVLSCVHDCSWGANITVNFGNQSRTVTNVARHPGGLDFVVYTLSSPMTINGSTSGFQSAMYTGTEASLNNQTLYSQGFGPGTCGGNDSVLRQGPMLAQGGDQYNVTYKNPPCNGSPNCNKGSAVTPGDSGGPFWKFFAGVPYQVGVTKAGDCCTAQQCVGGTCACTTSFAANPQAFEPFAFAAVNKTPIPIPTTSGCHNYTCAAGAGKGEWFFGNSGLMGNQFSDFWQRPLATRTNGWQCTPYFNPCPGSTNNYLFRADWSLNGNDTIALYSNNQSPVLTGTGGNGWWGQGNMAICYETNGAGNSPGLNWMDVQCDYGLTAEKLVCQGARCGNTVANLPKNFYQIVPWNPCGGGGFTYTINYSTVYPDNIWISGPGNGSDYYGTGTATGHRTGAVQVSIATDPNTAHYSQGIRALYAICDGW